MTFWISSRPHVVYPRMQHLHLGQCQCDCACALDLTAVPHGRLQGQVWTKQEDAVPVGFEGHWQVVVNPSGPVGIAALSPTGRAVWGAFEMPAALTDALRLLPDMPAAAFDTAASALAQVGLIRPVEMPAPGPRYAPILAAWLHVTEACNLNCAYCYVHKRPAMMTIDTGQHAVERLAELAVRDGYRTLKLKYAGGEPTLNFPVVEAVHAHAERRTREAGLALDEVLLTNGVRVTDAMLGFLAEGGLKLMVSLDGGPATHDRLRARRDGLQHLRGCRRYGRASDGPRHPA